MNIEQLQFDVNQFRDAIEKLQESEISVSTIGFKSRFPNGQCLNASQLLAHRLNDLNYHNVCVISGDKSSGVKTDTHAWVTVRNLIIDITADQFGEYDYPKVFIGQSSDLHSTYVSKKSFQQSIKGDLIATYSSILKCIS